MYPPPFVFFVECSAIGSHYTLNGWKHNFQCCMVKNVGKSPFSGTNSPIFELQLRSLCLCDYNMSFQRIMKDKRSLLEWGAMEFHLSYHSGFGPSCIP